MILGFIFALVVAALGLLSWRKKTRNVLSTVDTVDDYVGGGSSANDIAPKDLALAYQIAMEEVESGDKDLALWAKAYAHSETDDATKRYYVRERAAVLDRENRCGTEPETTSEAQAAYIDCPPVRKVRRIGFMSRVWFIVYFCFILLMRVGVFATLAESQRYSSLLPSADLVFVYAFTLVVIDLMFFFTLHRYITGRSFGTWPLDPKYRPRAFFGLFAAYQSPCLSQIVLALGLYLYDTHGQFVDVSFELMIISASLFVLSSLLGLFITFFYKIRVW